MNEMLDDLFHQGLRNIEDARFVRDSFIPVALSQNRWNIAVYEAHRATELLIRGMICQMGSKPPQDHNISGLVSFLVDRLPGARFSVIPFTVGAYTDNGEGYGIILEGSKKNSISLFRHSNNIFTQLAGYYGNINLPDQGQVDMRLELHESTVRVYLNNSLVLTATDSIHNESYKIVDRSFVRNPDTVKIRRLRELGEHLRKNRNPAYYGERIYTDDDAQNAISSMQESFDTAKSFFSFE